MRKMRQNMFTSYEIKAIVLATASILYSAGIVSSTFDKQHDKVVSKLDDWVSATAPYKT
jgi:hypothetical protein